MGSFIALHAVLCAFITLPSEPPGEFVQLEPLAVVLHLCLSRLCTGRHRSRTECTHSD